MPFYIYSMDILMFVFLSINLFIASINRNYHGVLGYSLAMFCYYVIINLR